MSSRRRVTETSITNLVACFEAKNLQIEDEDEEEEFKPIPADTLAKIKKKFADLEQQEGMDDIIVSNSEDLAQMLVEDENEDEDDADDTHARKRKLGNNTGERDSSGDGSSDSSKSESERTGHNVFK